MNITKIMKTSGIILKILGAEKSLKSRNDNHQSKLAFSTIAILMDTCNLSFDTIFKEFYVTMTLELFYDLEGS